jgi:ABC-type molybdate transport system substrate-binding protein
MGGDEVLAKVFLDFLTADAAHSLLERQGFAVLAD